MSIQPIKNFDELPAESLQKLAAEKDSFYSSPSICGFNPFIYGNDVDSVDVATRIAMVSKERKRIHSYIRNFLHHS